MLETIGLIYTIYSKYKGISIRLQLMGKEVKQFEYLNYLHYNIPVFSTTKKTFFPLFKVELPYVTYNGRIDR